jgi:hypothetical protein
VIPASLFGKIVSLTDGARRPESVFLRQDYYAAILRLSRENFGEVVDYNRGSELREKRFTVGLRCFLAGPDSSIWIGYNDGEKVGKRFPDKDRFFSMGCVSPESPVE